MWASVIIETKQRDTEDKEEVPPDDGLGEELVNYRFTKRPESL